MSTARPALRKSAPLLSPNKIVTRSSVYPSSPPDFYPKRPTPKTFRALLVQDKHLLLLNPDIDDDLTANFFESKLQFRDDPSTGTHPSLRPAGATQKTPSRKRKTSQLDLPRFNKKPLHLFPSHVSANPSQNALCSHPDSMPVSDNVIDECMSIPAIEVVASIRHLIVPKYFTYSYWGVYPLGLSSSIKKSTFDSQLQPADVVVSVNLFDKDASLTKLILLHADVGYTPLMMAQNALMAETFDQDGESSDAEENKPDRTHLFSNIVNLQHDIIALNFHTISGLLRDERVCGYALELSDYSYYGVAVQIVVPDFSPALYTDVSIADKDDTTKSCTNENIARRRVLHLTMINQVQQLFKVYAILSCLLPSSQSACPLRTCISVITPSDYLDNRTSSPVLKSIANELKQEVLRSSPRPQCMIKPGVDRPPFPKYHREILSLVSKYGARLNCNAHDIECECKTMEEALEEIAFTPPDQPHTWSAFAKFWSPFHTRFISAYRFSACIASAMCINLTSDTHLEPITITCPYAAIGKHVHHQEDSGPRKELKLTQCGANDSDEESDDDDDDDDDSEDDGNGGNKASKRSNAMHIAADVVLHIRQYIALRGVLLRAATSTN